MQTQHVPRIDRRYWFAIACASIFGTNLGDFYAHNSGLGIGIGLLVLAALFAAVMAMEKKDSTSHEAWYWLAIIIIRTGATNIADYSAYRLHIPALLLLLGLAGLIALLAWRNRPHPPAATVAPTQPTLQQTNLAYWSAMLAAGVFGTVGGDVSSHAVGQGPASITWAILLTAPITLLNSRAATVVWVYWCIVALARTAGTCMGDFLAESRSLHLGLPLSTLLTGAAFIAILALWPSTRRNPSFAA